MQPAKIIAAASLLLLLCSCVGADSAVDLAAPASTEDPEVREHEEPEKEERDEVMELLAQMTLEDKIGQLIFAGYRPENPEHLETLILNHKVGGIILFRRNIPDLPGMLAATSQINEMNSDNPLPLFVGIDEEGGTVSRLPEGAMKLPDARILGSINDPDLTYWAALALAHELRALGVNVNFAPVLDVYLPGTEFLYHRSFGTDPDVVALHGTAFAAGLRQGKVLAVGKHFPGHGATPVDSHRNLPHIREPLNVVEKRELTPFRAAIAADIGALMVGHLAFAALDESSAPATRSAPMVTDLLRNELGFDGLVISDDLEMGAYLEGSTWEQAVVASINAGCDMLIIAHSLDRQIRAIESLHEAVMDGTLGMAQLDAAVSRIIRAKLELGLDSQPLPAEEAISLVGREQSKSILQEIEKRR